MGSKSSQQQRAGRLARAYLAVLRFLGMSSGWIRRDGYRPEKHYMRGPGPKSRSRESR